MANKTSTTEGDFQLRFGSVPKERNVTEVIGLAERCLLLLEHAWRTESDGRAIHLVENEEYDRIEWAGRVRLVIVALAGDSHCSWNEIAES